MQVSRLQADMAAEVRATYCVERNRWHSMRQGKHTNWGSEAIARYDGGEDSSGRVFKKNVWVEIVRFAAKHEANPVKLVRAQFRAATAHPPQPTQCLSDRGLAIYKEFLASTTTDIMHALHYQKAALSTELGRTACRKANGASDKDVLMWALSNTLVSLSPLFRLCVARSSDIELDPAFFRGAMEQYLEEPAEYDRLWGELIPLDLKTESKKLTEEASSGRLLDLD